MTYLLAGHRVADQILSFDVYPMNAASVIWIMFVTMVTVKIVVVSAEMRLERNMRMRIIPIVNPRFDCTSNDVVVDVSSDEVSRRLIFSDVAES
jgi:hypothetical protein